MLRLNQAQREIAEQLTTDGPQVVSSAAAAPVGQMQNCKKLSSVEKESSALHTNIADKGGNSYYFAHSRQYEIPADAKIITGPGLVAGGPPQKLSGPDGAIDEIRRKDPANSNAGKNAESQQEPTKEAIGLKEYSWSDDGMQVKVYVPCDCLPAGATESLISSKFEKRSFRLEIATRPVRFFKLDKLSKDIVPEGCKVRVNAAKGKITISLSKKRGGFWPDLVGGP